MDWLAASQRPNRVHISVLCVERALVPWDALRLWHDGAPGGCLPWCPELPGCQQLSIHRRCPEGTNVGAFHGQMVAAQCHSWIGLLADWWVSSRYAIRKVQHFHNQRSALRFPKSLPILGSKNITKNHHLHVSALRGDEGWNESWSLPVLWPGTQKCRRTKRS